MTIAAIIGLVCSAIAGGLTALMKVWKIGPWNPQNDVEIPPVEPVVPMPAPIEPMPVEPAPTTYPDLLTEFCLQIQAYEGYIPPCKQYPTGTAAWRNRNPGNLRYNGQAHTTGKSAAGFAIFDTYEHGFEALEALVINVAGGSSKIYGKNPTIDSFFAVYAPESDNNIPKRYALTVAKNLGLSPSTLLRDFISV